MSHRNGPPVDDQQREALEKTRAELDQKLRERGVVKDNPDANRGGQK